jgi:hypothetical protein
MFNVKYILPQASLVIPPLHPSSLLAKFICNPAALNFIEKSNLTKFVSKSLVPWDLKENQTSVWV